MLEGLPIITERLIINPFTEADAPFYNQMLNSPGYLKYIADRGVRTDEAAAQMIRERIISGYEKHGFGFYLMRLRHMDFPIGSCGMTKRDHLEDIDVGYNLLEEYQGMGYAYEGTKAIIQHAQDYHNAKRLIAVTSEENKSSQKLLDRLGFSFDKMVAWSEEEDVKQFELIL